MNAALRYSKERESFGKKIFEHQAVAFRPGGNGTRSRPRGSWYGTPLR